jgi:hypothetical protein
MIIGMMREVIWDIFTKNLNRKKNISLKFSFSNFYSNENNRRKRLIIRNILRDTVCVATECGCFFNLQDLV